MKKLVFLLAGFALLSIACERDATNDAFAQCINDSGAAFYGSFTCPHCADQKKMFGDSVDLLPYVECNENSKDADLAACDANGVVKWPTWVFADGRKEEGVLSFEELSEYTSCPLPANESVMVKPD